MSSREADAAQASHGARALAAAVTQIELALREAANPIEKLGLRTESLSNAIKALQAARRPAGTGPDSPVTTPPIEEMQADLSDIVQHLQFFDRMVQHLSHVQSYLSSVADQLASVAESRESTDIWEGLRAKLRTNLISDAQRELLDLVLPPPAGTASARQKALEEPAHQGTVDLF
jgi:hypothetical protein